MATCQPSLLASGDETIIWIAENLRHDWLSPFVILISNLGSFGPILLIMSFAYWCWNKRHSRVILYGILLSLLANIWLKGIVMECRPPQRCHLEIIPEASYSFPSGHAQVTILMWWGLAYYVRSKWLAALYLLIGVLISLSRPYMGVHYVHDVLAGFTLGVMILALCIWNEKKNILKLDHLPLWGQSLVVILFLVICNLAINNQTGHLCIATSILFGIWLGGQLEEKYVQFIPSFKLRNIVQYAVVGFGGAMAIWKGGDLLRGVMPSIISYPLEYLQFTVLGLWIAYLAPRIINKELPS